MSNNEKSANSRGVVSRSAVPSITATCFTEIAAQCATQQECLITLESNLNSCGCMESCNCASVLTQLQTCCQTIQSCCDSGASSLGAAQAASQPQTA